MGNTILHILISDNRTNLVPEILMKDISLLKALNARNETPFHHAARSACDFSIIGIMVTHAKSIFGEAGMKEILRQKNCLGETALHEAARQGHESFVRVLMNADWELAGLVNDDFASPLYLATAMGSLCKVQTMMQKLSRREITREFYLGPKKQTALHAAVLKDSELTKELLKLNSGQLGKEADETGRTPLHFIASTGNHTMAKLLLDKDPSLAYIQDSEGSFPVHTAARMGHVKIMVLLSQVCLDSGDLLDGNGRNFLHIAIEANESDVILKWLEDSKNNLPISHWNKIFTRMLNTMDNKGNTPLHLAAKHGRFLMLSRLNRNASQLKRTLQNKEGLTALDISMIQLRKSAGKSKSRDIFEEFYNQKRDGLTTGWFQYYTEDKMSKSESIGIMELAKKIIKGTIQDPIWTMDTTGAKKSSDSVIAKAQLVGLGSVLITTVSFAAAFTLPGGTNGNTGTPILERKYPLKAFALANYSAFFLSFLSTMLLIYSSSYENSDRMEIHVATSLSLFSIAAKCMVLALTFGLDVVLAPVSNTTATVVKLLSSFLLLIENPNGIWRYYRMYNFRMVLLKHIPDGASRVKSKFFGINKEMLYILYRMYAPTLVPLLLILVIAIF
ncbi:protein ACCELERATED CELL DEATH 6-like [Carex rostrata]